MVLTIIGTIAAIAQPRFMGYVMRYRHDLAARRLTSDLEYASTLARVRSAPVKILFDKGEGLDESRYWFENVEDPDKPGEPYTVVFRQEPYNVIIKEAPGDITYDIDGLPTHSKTFVLGTNPDYQRTIEVDENTGEITLN